MAGDLLSLGSPASILVGATGLCSQHCPALPTASQVVNSLLQGSQMGGGTPTWGTLKEFMEAFLSRMRRLIPDVSTFLLECGPVVERDCNHNTLPEAQGHNFDVKWHVNFGTSELYTTSVSSSVQACLAAQKLCCLPELPAHSPMCGKGSAGSCLELISSTPLLGKHNQTVRLRLETRRDPVTVRQLLSLPL